MFALIRLFWDICTFQRGPQDTPYSQFLLGMMLVLEFALGALTLLIPNSKDMTHALSQIVAYVLADMLLTIGFVILVLWVHSKTMRVVQTITTLFATDILLGIIQLPFIFVAMAAGNQVNMLGMYYLGSIIILMWQLGVYSHIFRHALSISIFRGGGFALVLFFLGMYLHAVMLPVAN